MSSNLNDAATLTPRANWRILWPVALILTLLISSSQPVFRPPMPPVIGFDKFAHLGVYGLLATLIVRTPRVWRMRRGRFWTAVGLAAGYGVFDELYQGTTGRSPDIYDWIADALGALLAVTLYLRWTNYRKCLEWRLPITGRRLRSRPAMASES